MVGEQHKRELPAHIAAQLRSAGRATDTGGQPWEGRNLGEGTSHTHSYPGDDGKTAPALQEAFEAFVAGEIPEEAVVDALREVRIFAPVIAQISQSHINESGLVEDKEADMALISIQAPDGRKALPIFTRVDALTAWHEQARPVAADMRKTALSAVEDENQLMVIDPGQDLTFVLRRPALWALAKGQPWVPSYADARVAAELERLAEGIPAILEVRGEKGAGVASKTASGAVLSGGGAGPELAIVLRLVPGLNREQLNTAVGAFQQALAHSALVSELVDSVQLKLTA